MSVIVLSAFNVARYPRAGGHFWVYLQYADALRRLGCEVYWMEDLQIQDDPCAEQRRVEIITRRLGRYGFSDHLILYRSPAPGDGHGRPYEFANIDPSRAEAVFGATDVLLNFDYRMGPELLARFRRTALVDIDPGLLQYWVSSGQLVLHAHDAYLSTGETVGTACAPFADCGLTWNHIAPGVSLDLWPFVGEAGDEAFTTVSSWWSSEWIELDGKWADNTKRASFLRFADLPAKTSQPLELTLALGGGSDVADQRLLESHGWRVRRADEVVYTPEAYQSYIQRSRGEFSCAKASCMRFHNAWVSDRTLCYLASGKPVVVEDTGPSTILPNGLGMFRFTTPEEAVDALAAVNSAYRVHSHAAREIAEANFDARRSATRMLEVAL